MIKENIQIRETLHTNFNDIMTVEKQAFGYDKEAELVAGLLKDKSAKPFLSLLAFYEGEAIGHILFTRVYLDEMKEQPLAHLLAPLAVKPDFQKKGIGGMLIKAGLDILQKQGSELVFVLGHIEYYPKYDFIPDAKKLGFQAPYPIPEEFADAWMVQELSEGAIDKYQGRIRCADELQKPEHWQE